MKSLVNALAVVIVMAILAACAYGLYWGGGYLWERIGELEATTRVVLLTAVAALLLAALIVAAGLRSAARGIGQGRLLEHRLDLYRELFDRHRCALTVAEGHRGERAPEALDFELSLLAGASVMDAHFRLCEAVRDPAASPRKSEAALAELLKAMRRDLGHAQSLDEAKLDELVFADAERAQGGGMPSPQT